MLWTEEINQEEFIVQARIFFSKQGGVLENITKEELEKSQNALNNQAIILKHQAYNLEQVATGIYFYLQREKEKEEKQKAQDESPSE